MNRAPVRIVARFGVHQWFMHKILEEETVLSSEGSDLRGWMKKVEERLRATPYSIVGEIGLGGFHFRPSSFDEPQKILPRVNERIGKKGNNTIAFPSH